MTIVYGFGRKPNRVMLVGEAPGREEASANPPRPFVGRSGHEQNIYLSRHRLSTASWYLTNVVKRYTPGNPTPTPEEVAEWSPVLHREISEVQPELIVAVGATSAKWFLGDSTVLDTVHGLPHESGALDPTRKDRSRGAVVVPIYHPAAAFYDTKNEIRATIAWDYSQVAAILGKINSGEPIEFRRDEFVGREQYVDVSGEDLAVLLSVDCPPIIALDTEGTPDNPWSIQVSWSAGVGYVLRCERGDFAEGIAALQHEANRRGSRPLFVMHSASTPAGCMYDLTMCKAMGLDLTMPWVRLRDTMYDAYLLRLEPQGMKPLAYRWCGMAMRDYGEVIGDIAQAKRVAYLEKVWSMKWPKPEPELKIDNDGGVRIYKPQATKLRAKSILTDLYSGKTDKDGNPVDLTKRWKMVGRGVRRMVAAELGPWPEGTLADIELRDAVRYAARDADAAYRVFGRLSEELERLDLTTLAEQGSEVLPVFWEMQQTGMPASRKRFEDLSAKMTEEMLEIGHRLSRDYFDGRPFNPKSSPQTATLLRRRGLHSAKRTKGGAASTGKPGIEHLRHEDEAIAQLFEWRERQHTRDMFCETVLGLMAEDPNTDDDKDIVNVRCVIKTTRTTSRRPASKEPNLLAQTKHSAYGKMIRGCYVCSDGEVFAEWDHSQIEARFLAHESGDKRLCGLFNSRKDVHIATASEIFGEPEHSVTKNKRTLAKKVTYGVPYGTTKFGLETQLRMMGITDWTADDCDRFIREWMVLHPGAAKYIAVVEQEAARTGMVRSRWGMIRYLPGVWADDKKVTSESKRQAVNHRIQDGAQGLIQRAIAYLRPIVYEWQQQGMNVRWCLEPHDAILMRISEEVWPIVNPVVMDAMVNHCGMTLRVPIEAEGSYAKTWGELE